MQDSAQTASVMDHMSRDAAIAFHGKTIDLLTAAPAREALGLLRPGSDAPATSLPLMPPDMTHPLVSELAALPTWATEHWLLTPDDNVKPCGEDEFTEAPPERRFSRSGCLRDIPRDALGIRAFISALKSTDVADAFSEAFGERVSFRSADIAKYEAGHYLRRHSDTFDDRRFGLVFFLSPGWAAGDGGELVVEAPSGAALATQPEQGRVALLRINPGYHHSVCAIRSQSWVRYSIAVHFGTAK
ncbi:MULTISPECIES: 2OG-Fe(II) oxygenase [Streptomyces]|uniref:2OG-Fe(II) oxygenase n=1 Tax=Streptomyces koelreuteriae TaxID=2838015 RepID=A0ABX8FTA9_9ACTN|nr:MULTISPECIES: 2OG-Fe(II) oxygenase [Streptomyces]QWB24448.1 2OG-Fe(II) oxygenase [Streptomyces koelreuteriae]UUA07454.1 2OG-Fe(II) oxygenase [Streptomyces koelreuteriae]UUA15083.1 2OG-Fe(II) oxygenase [Streptomyces sp. CRCS-T-1]